MKAGPLLEGQRSSPDQGLKTCALQLKPQDPHNIRSFAATVRLSKTDIRISRISAAMQQI